LDKLNDELKDVTKVMTKNIEDLLYRGDSLERMGEMSGRLREDSKKYRKAAVRINWELMLKQVSLHIDLTFWKTYGSPCVVWPFCWVGIVHYNVYLVAVLLMARALTWQCMIHDTQWSIVFGTARVWPITSRHFLFP
jgi:hypothetical protein